MTSNRIVTIGVPPPPATLSERFQAIRSTSTSTLNPSSSSSLIRPVRTSETPTHHHQKNNRTRQPRLLNHNHSFHAPPQQPQQPHRNQLLPSESNQVARNRGRGRGRGIAKSGQSEPDRQSMRAAHVSKFRTEFNGRGSHQMGSGSVGRGQRGHAQAQRGHAQAQRGLRGQRGVSRGRGRVQNASHQNNRLEKNSHQATKNQQQNQHVKKPVQKGSTGQKSQVDLDKELDAYMMTRPKTAVVKLDEDLDKYMASRDEDVEMFE